MLQKLFIFTQKDTLQVIRLYFENSVKSQNVMLKKIITGKSGFGWSKDNGRNLVPFWGPPIKITALIKGILNFSVFFPVFSLQLFLQQISVKFCFCLVLILSSRVTSSNAVFWQKITKPLLSGVKLYALTWKRTNELNLLFSK